MTAWVCLSGLQVCSACYAAVLVMQTVSAVQAGLTYRAIMANVRTFRWERALQLAQKHKVHVATVLLERSRYLIKAGTAETDKQFQQCNAEVEVDEATVKQQVQQEGISEAARPGAVGYA